MNQLISFLIVFFLAFLCGSLMFSYWLGLSANKNIRTVGDGNPGAANLWSAAGYKYGISGVFLDFSKGYMPVYLINNTASFHEYAMIPLVIAPILGHAFSPFLKFSGGKSLAVTFGVWSAFTNFEISFMYALILAVLEILMLIRKKGIIPSSEEHSFLTIFGFLLLIVYLYKKDFSYFVLVIWLCNYVILLYKNKESLVLFLKNRLLR